MILTAKEEQLVALRRAGWKDEMLWVMAHQNVRVIQTIGTDLMLLDDVRLVHRTLTPAHWIGAWDDVAAGSTVEAYTDGSGVATDKSVGCAAVFPLKQDHYLLRAPSIEFAIGEPATYLYPDQSARVAAMPIGPGTNNIAELTGIWLAVAGCPRVDLRLKIWSDSEYAIGSLTKDWKAKKNGDLIAQIRRHIEARGNVEFEHVRGHNGDPLNELADKWAGMARKR